MSMPTVDQRDIVTDSGTAIIDVVITEPNVTVVNVIIIENQSTIVEIAGAKK